MCVYSMIADYGMKYIWPNPQLPFSSPPVTVIQHAPDQMMLEEMRAIRSYLELLLKAKDTDTATGQPDCEDPKKVEWVHSLESRLERLEKVVEAMGAR